MDTEKLILSSVEDARQILSFLILETLRSGDDSNFSKLEIISKSLDVYIKSFELESMKAFSALAKTLNKGPKDEI